MLRSNPTIRSIGVLITLLIICCTGAVIIRSNIKRPAFTKESVPNVKITWKTRVGHVSSMVFSHNDEYVCLADRSGNISCFTADGIKCYSTRIPGADSVAITPNGNYAVAYSRLNPISGQLTFLNSSGQIHWRMDVPGAVWSADAENDDDGGRFAIGTGERHIYIIRVSKNRKRYRRWRTPGAVVSISFDRRGETAFLGTWQQSTISRITVSGRRLWEQDMDSTNLNYIQSLARSHNAFLRAVPNRLGASSEYAFLDEDGNIIRNGTSDSSRDTRILSSPDSFYLCMGYSKLISHEGKSVREKHVVLYDDTGGMLWDKGSVFFQAMPILVTAGGYVLVSGGKNILFTISPTGSMHQCAKLPASILDVLPSRDGSRVLVHCADNVVYMLRISR